MISCFRGKRHEDEGNNQKFFIKNGGDLLKELVAFSNGRPNPIPHFSAKELLIATNYYDSRQIVVQDIFYKLYKGYLKEIPIFVKKYDNDRLLRFHSAADPFKDIAIGSQMRAHKNVLKVLGCCLETEKPTIVYEYAGTKTLSTCISATSGEPLPWKCRLKIAVDIANAIAYLHNVFDRPVIHRDIRCDNIILDKNNVPKLIDFGLCISIPEGQSHVASSIVRRIDGAWGTPEYTFRHNVAEKIDVYRFGWLLADLFTGNKPIHEMKHSILDWEKRSHRTFRKLVDPRVKDEGIEPFKFLDFISLCSRCACMDKEKRPTMIEVAKELGGIYQSYFLVAEKSSTAIRGSSNLARTYSFQDTGMNQNRLYKLNKQGHSKISDWQITYPEARGYLNDFNSFSANSSTEDHTFRAVELNHLYDGNLHIALPHS
ncbi:hypothetical protein DITRI_Ditri06bG0166900 [Diplodiscus trichospermus]